MNLTRETLYKTNGTIIDGDVSPQLTVILHKGKGENLIIVNDQDVFSVSAQSYMIRILDENLVIYDGETLQFFTVDGTCTQKITVGRHLYDLFPMKDAVACTYCDEGVFGHKIGKQKIVVVHKNGTINSCQSFANEHHLDFDIRFARIKPYACLSIETILLCILQSIFSCKKQFHVRLHLEILLRWDIDIRITYL